MTINHEKPQYSKSMQAYLVFRTRGYYTIVLQGTYQSTNQFYLFFLQHFLILSKLTTNSHNWYSLGRQTQCNYEIDTISIQHDQTKKGVQIKGNLLPFATFFVLYGKIAGALPIFDRFTSTAFLFWEQLQTRSYDMQR